jgi:hypothetical protein
MEIWILEQFPKKGDIKKFNPVVPERILSRRSPSQISFEFQVESKGDKKIL